MEKNEEDKVWVTISRTINLGNYENIKIDAGMSRTIGEANDPQDLLDLVCDEVNTIVAHKAKQFKNELTKKKKVHKNYEDMSIADNPND